MFIRILLAANHAARDALPEMFVRCIDGSVY